MEGEVRDHDVTDDPFGDDEQKQPVPGHVGSPVGPEDDEIGQSFSDAVSQVAESLMKPKEATRYFTALVRGKIVSTEDGKNIHVSTLRSTIQNCIIQDPTPDGSVVFDEDIDVLVK